MSDPFVDPVCNPTGIDPSLFPMGSALKDPNYNIIPFLCELMKIATDPNASSVLVEPTNFDDSPFMQYDTLTAVGDHRFSDGALIKAGFSHFLPRLIAQLEMRQSGGNSFADNFICDADGNPIKLSTTIPILDQLAQGGYNLYGYEAAPTDPNELLKPFGPDDIVQFINNTIIDNSEKAADDFVEFLQLYYPTAQWKPSLHSFKTPPFFYIELDYMGKKENIVYIKYHAEMQDYVAKKLLDVGYIPLNSTIDLKIIPDFSSGKLVLAFSEPIPNYSELLNNHDEAVKSQIYSIDNHSAMADELYSKFTSSIIELDGIDQTIKTLITEYK
jgi:hypothetical protein